MDSLDGFLSRFKSILGASGANKDLIISIIQEHSQILLDKKDFEIKDDVIRVEGSPGLKSALYINKPAILKALQEKLGDKAPRDIR